MKDVRWPVCVAAEYHKLQEMTPEISNPIVRLRQLKTAIRVTSARLVAENAEAATSTTPASPLGAQGLRWRLSYDSNVGGSRISLGFVLSTLPCGICSPWTCCSRPRMFA